MARARNIKPAFFQNDSLGELCPLARLLFIGMWTIADYKGCLEFRPRRVKTQILPYDDCDVSKLAINLDKSGFISIYSVSGQLYVKIINFERHQNPHKNEREAGSNCPDISEKDNEINDLENIEINLDKNGSAPADSLFPLSDSLNPLTDSAQLASCAASPKYSAINELIALGVDRQVASDWLKVRKAKKSAQTKTGIDGVLREIQKAGMTPDQGIRICCERGWAGFKPDWLSLQQQSRASPGYKTANEKAKEWADKLTGKSNDSNHEIIDVDSTFYEMDRGFIGQDEA